MRMVHFSTELFTPYVVRMVPPSVFPCFNKLKTYFKRKGSYLWVSNYVFIKLSVFDVFNKKSVFRGHRFATLDIFSRRFSSEKSPTITVASFFCQTTILTLIGPIFLQQKLRNLLRPSRARGNLVQRVPPIFF